MNGKHGQALVWDDLRVFLAVARRGTLSGAAGQLHLGLATVSRRIERLEQDLGRPLFLRQQTGYRLTEDGLSLRERAEEMEATAHALTASLRSTPEVSGHVRLATAENLATELILPALPRLTARYPQLTLEIVTDIAPVNLHRRDADLALRMIRPERGHVTLQRLGVLGYGLYGAPDYMARRQVLDDAGSHDHDSFITWAETQAHLPAAQWVENLLQGRAPVLMTTSLATQLAACMAGTGLAVLPHFLARPRGLVCLRGDLGIDQSIWLITQSDLVLSRRVQAVAGFCRDLVKDRQADLAHGPPPPAAR
ncbi:LysR family transcriptional regulator [Paracoccus sp. (in: a-proteobacteria)]|uniref:LysR family transcriptional regulator n=1 Tax=Paracoccus sp. TaxID=267 RepID=UPI0035AE89C3